AVSGRRRFRRTGAPATRSVLAGPPLLTRQVLGEGVGVVRRRGLGLRVRGCGLGGPHGLGLVARSLPIGGAEGGGVRLVQWRTPPSGTAAGTGLRGPPRPRRLLADRPGLVRVVARGARPGVLPGGAFGPEARVV